MYFQKRIYIINYCDMHIPEIDKDILQYWEWVPKFDTISKFNDFVNFLNNILQENSNTLRQFQALTSKLREKGILTSIVSQDDINQASSLLKEKYSKYIFLSLFYPNFENDSSLDSNLRESRKKLLNNDP